MDSSVRPEDARICFIDQPLLIRPAYRHLYDELLKCAPVMDSPEDVERVLGLDQAYPVAARANVPQTATAFISLDDETVLSIKSQTDVRRSLTERIYKAAFEQDLDPHRGLYIRGFYSSLKTADPFYYFAGNQEEVEATVYEVIRNLRESFEVGGLAIREMIDLKKLRLPPLEKDRPAAKVPFEFRITFLEGRPIMANYHGPFNSTARSHERGIVRGLEKHRKIIDRIRPLAHKMRDFPPNFVADFAFYKDGEPVLIETNPLYSSGYNVPEAHAWLLANLGNTLAMKAGYDPVDVRRSTERLIGRKIREHAGFQIWN